MHRVLTWVVRTFLCVRSTPAFNVHGHAEEQPVASRSVRSSCIALSGEPIAALGRLTGLLADEISALAADDPRPYRLRRQIALLELGMG